MKLCQFVHIIIKNTRQQNTRNLKTLALFTVERTNNT